MAVERIRRRRPVRQRIIEVGRKKVVKVRSRGLFVLPNLFTTASLFCAVHLDRTGNGAKLWSGRLDDHAQHAL